MALIALGMSAPAMAADMPVKAPPPAPVYYDWSGAYVGFSIGGVWADVDRFYPQAIGGALTATTRTDDAIYGFHAGTQWQWGGWVLGIEAAYSACFRECQGSIFYSRCNFSSDAGGAIHCFDMVYPQEAKRAFDYVVTRVSRSLRPLETRGAAPGS